MISIHFSFIGLDALGQAILTKTIFTGGTTILGLAYWLFVIALGVALISFYVWSTNHQPG